MSEAYIGEIRIFAGSFAPYGWNFCDGSVLAISEFDALFNLIGTTYGGDGQQTFALPDLRSRVLIHQGTGAGLPTYVIGQQGGSENVTLTSIQMPGHTHALQASSAASTGAAGGGGVLAASSVNIYGSGTPNVSMSAQAINALGGSKPHNNLAPYVAVNYIISLFGIFPSQN